MPLQREHDAKVFVYFVESPSPDDFFIGRSEGGVIAQAARLNQIPCAGRCVASGPTLEKALICGLYAEMLKNSDRLPMLHISAHGNGEGISLTDSTFISWDQLRKYLKPLNKAFAGNLFLCMSSCEGASASRMSMHVNDLEFPYSMLVSNYGTPTWSETAIGYATLYHHIAAGRTIPQAVEAMKIASGNDDFFCRAAVESHNGFLDYLTNYADERQQAALAQMASLVNYDKPGAAGEVKSQLTTPFPQYSAFG